MSQQTLAGFEKYGKTTRRARFLTGMDLRGDRTHGVVHRVPRWFYRELCALEVQYDQMASAVDWQDPARMRATACGVALAWLQMEAAFIQFIDGTPVQLSLGHSAKPEVGIDG